MSDQEGLQKLVEQFLLRLKAEDINTFLKPDEIKELFKKALPIKNPYWELNKDCDKLTKFGIIFRPQQAYIQKGKPIYAGFFFESLSLTILLEEQYARTKDNTFKIPYQTLLTNWDDFSDSISSIFNNASNLANGVRDF
jgi:5'-deoxynucleotidase YfbR-like HD superfamily hydrolase